MSVGTFSGRLSDAGVVIGFPDGMFRSILVECSEWCGGGEVNKARVAGVTAGTTPSGIPLVEGRLRGVPWVVGDSGGTSVTGLLMWEGFKIQALGCPAGMRFSSGGTARSM